MRAATPRNVRTFTRPRRRRAEILLLTRQIASPSYNATGHKTKTALEARVAYIVTVNTAIFPAFARSRSPVAATPTTTSVRNSVLLR